MSFRLILPALILAVLAIILGSIWLTGRQNETAAPDAANPPAAFVPGPTPVAEPLAYTVCSEGDGWLRPGPDDQRRHLVSLGGTFEQLASQGYLFVGAYVQDARGAEVWRYGLFWASVADAADEQYALARSGLWSAAPDSTACDRTAALTLLIDHAAIGMRFAGDTVTIVARAQPGHFEYIQYAPPLNLHAIGYRLVSEDGTFIDACCT